MIDIQRGGPSTGLPTKTEQADLLEALFGRHGEAPLPVVAPSTPGDCFYTVIEAARLAIKYRTPVILLSDGYLANGAEPWPIPDVEQLPDLAAQFSFATGPNKVLPDGTETFWPYLRDTETLARPWALPGTPGLMHRIGGLEKADGSGNVSYDPANHDLMVRLRAEKVAGIAKDIPRSSSTTPMAWVVPTCSCSDGARPAGPFRLRSARCVLWAVEWLTLTSGI